MKKAQKIIESFEKDLQKDTWKLIDSEDGPFTERTYEYIVDRDLTRILIFGIYDGQFIISMSYLGQKQIFKNRIKLSDFKYLEKNSFGEFFLNGVQLNNC